MLDIRLATLADLPVLHDLMERAINRLQRDFLDDDQIAASHVIMGVDTALVEDRTYFVVEMDGTIAGCGGWSRRATLYGGDPSHGRDAALLDPTTDAASVRAMYTEPHLARHGVGRLVLRACEAAAAAEGFSRLEVIATLAGQPFYRSVGFEVEESFNDASSGVAIPLLKMTKAMEHG